MSWRDQKDLIVIESDEREWHEEAKNQEKMCLESVDDRKATNDARVVCEGCHTRLVEKVIRKDTSILLKPICQQKGAIHCSICDKWFHSISGFSL